jgi:hypothetical protein
MLAFGLMTAPVGCSCDGGTLEGAGGGAAVGGGAAASGSGGFSASGGTGGFAAVGGAGGVGGGVGGTNACADVDITGTNAIPTVWLLLDGSSSMQQAYGNTTRWRALRDALVGPNGVLRTLDDRINFGMAIFAGQYITGEPLGTGQCPIPGIPVPATTSQPIYANCNGTDAGGCGAIIGTLAGRNFAQIEMTLPVNDSPGQRTPSGEALNWLYDRLAPGVLEPDGERAPIYVIFATDGEPNSCDGMGTAPTFQGSEDAIARGRGLDITTYVVSLAQGADINNTFAAHLQRLANLGAGLASSAMPGATLYSPQDPAALSRDLGTLLSATLGCSLPIRGNTVDVAKQCDGSSVTLNGVALVCQDPNGWSVDSTGRTLVLAGTACAEFMNDAAVQGHATFPCDVLVLQ